MKDEDRFLPRRFSGRAIARNDVRDLMRRFLVEDDVTEDLEWDSITTADGLPHNWIYDIFQDSVGRIWVATWGGGVALRRSDTWETFGRRHGLPSDAATCIRESADGTIWVATNGGLSRFDGNRFVDAGLTGEGILNIHVDREQNLWAGCWRKGRSTGCSKIRRAADFTASTEASGRVSESGTACPAWTF